MRNNHPQSLESLFNDTNQLQRIQQQVAILRRLDRALRPLLPAPLRQGCRVANYRQSILVLEVANGSQQLRMRYLQSDLLSALRSSILPSLASIDIRINPRLSPAQINQQQDTTLNPTHQRSDNNSQRRKISKKSASYLRAIATNYLSQQELSNQGSSQQLRKRLLHLASLAGERANDTDGVEE